MPHTFLICDGPISEVVDTYAWLLQREEDPSKGLFSAEEMQLLDAVHIRLKVEGIDGEALGRELEDDGYRVPDRFLKEVRPLAERFGKN